MKSAKELEEEIQELEQSNANLRFILFWRDILWPRQKELRTIVN